eukprot:c9377_g1_i1 orf=796-3156(+)
MTFGGATATLSNRNLGARSFIDIGSMPAGLMVPSRLLNTLPMPLQPRNAFSSPGLSLAPPSGLEGHIDFSQSADSEQIKSKEEEYDSKSSSDNGGSAGEDHDGERPNKKRYHRHSQHQIQEMERVFKECQHPDDKRRQELSRELNLDPRQVKFWFQNKRTQMKNQHERQENQGLRSENERLKAENFALRDAIRNVSCPSCGGPANLAEMSFDEQQLRIENVKLRDEIDRISTIAAKYVGRPITTFTSFASAPSSTIDMGFSVAIPGMGSEIAAPGPSVADIAARPLGLTEGEKPIVVELAVAAMEELIQVSQAVEPLWVLDPQTGIELMDREHYLQRFPRGIGPAPFGLKSETSRQAGLVIMNSNALVETLMDVNRWIDMFPYIISRAFTVEVLSTGVAGTYDGAMQLMYAEFQVPSPLVPTRENYFLRYSKRVDNTWVVVDVSLDSLRGNPPPSLLRCRRRPSGCVIEEMPNGYSKVTWVEHVEVDNSKVHALYQAFVNCGIAFGAQRWVATLQRQCERIASLLASNISSREVGVIPTPEGRRSMLKLAERMTNNFCGGVSASTAHSWITLSGTGADDVRVVIRKSVDDPGKPPGIVLSAATSLWLPVSPARVFEFLRDERFRTEWDILSNMGVVEEMVHVAKGPDPGNSVSLLRVNAVNTNQSNMLILQECCTDESSSLVIYAPVDISAMSSVLNGGDPDGVALLPSGFAILPDGPQRNRTLGISVSGGISSPASTGSLLTVAFQILVDHVPTAKLSLGSVATVNNLISSTVLRIKSALVCDST